MLTVDHLLALVGPFCDKRKISESRLSTLLFNDGKRVAIMRDRNGDISSRRLREAFQWFSDHWPEAAVWPDEIPRPSQTVTIAAPSAPPSTEASAA